MGNVEAIKTYFSKDSRAVENREILELRKGMKKEEFDEMGRACAAALNAEYSPA